MDKEIRLIPKKNRLIGIILLYFSYIITLFVVLSDIEGRSIFDILTMLALGIFTTTFCYYISSGLTKVYMRKDGCMVVRGRKKVYHSWEEFRIIRHSRFRGIYGAPFINNEIILFSTEELKNTNVKEVDWFMFLKNKYNIFCINLATEERIEKHYNELDSLWYEREEFLETLGQWGIKIESDCEDLTKYYIPKKEDHIVQLVDGIFIKKIQENQWKIVTTLFEHIIEYNENKNELFINGIKTSFSENSIVRFIGIDEEFQIDDKNIRIIVRNKKMRIVHKGKYVDINEPYIPLKAERMIYFVIPFPVILASIGALKGIQELFVISFAILIVLYTYVVKAIKIYNTEQ